MATLFGTNLSSSTETITPPWLKTSGGTEVHLVPLNTNCGTASLPANLSCELVADLIYVSPTQINFVVPDVPPSAYGQQELMLEVVLVENAQRFDAHVSFSVSTIGDFAVFGVGYDCDFALSLAHPEACGYSQTPGPNKVPIGAITDASGNLFTAQNPIHPGQPIVLWATGLQGLTSDPVTGLMQQKPPKSIPLSLSHGTVLNPNWNNQTPAWAGESPQYEGLDQVNLTVPVCNGTSAATELRYDIILNFQAPSANSSLGTGFAKLYLPFIIRPGEATCESVSTTTITTVSSNANPSTPGQAVALTASVSPPDATGTVIFFDGGSTLGIGTLVGGSATCGINSGCSTSGLGVGGHSIQVTYNGDMTHKGSSGTLNQAVTQKTNITLASSANPAAAGQSVTIFATVTPCCAATGTVSFLDGSTTIGSAPLVAANGYLVATLPTSGLSGGTHSITAIYGGDSYNYASTSPALAQTLAAGTVLLSIAYSPTPVVSGLPVTFGVTLSSTSATGNVSLFDGNVTLSTSSVSNGKANFSVPSLSAGSHTITATYNGDSKFSSAFVSIALSVMPNIDVTNLTISNTRLLWQPDGSYIAGADLHWTNPSSVSYGGVNFYKTAVNGNPIVPPVPLYGSSYPTSATLQVPTPNTSQQWTITAISVDTTYKADNDPTAPHAGSPQVIWSVGPPGGAVGGTGQEYAPLVNANGVNIVTNQQISTDGVPMMRFNISGWSDPSDYRFGGVKIAMVENAYGMTTYWDVGKATIFTTPWQPAGDGDLTFYFLSYNTQSQVNSILRGFTPSKTIQFKFIP
jgi:uncharacterized protein (TIGR03437 family)